MKIKALHILLLFAIADMYGALHLSSSKDQAVLFEENKGQVKGLESKQVNFVLHQGSFSLFLMDKGIAYQFSRNHYPEGCKPLGVHASMSERAAWQEMMSKSRTEVYRMDIELVGANTQAEIIKEDKSSSYTNYYNAGVDKVYSYSKITYKNIYNHIDWVIYKSKENIEYDFVVHPGGNPNDIQLKTKWVEEIQKRADGGLVFKNRLGTITENAPISTQNGARIKTTFHVNGETIRFQVSDYDKSKTLIIDPFVNWSSYYGNEVDQTLTSTAIDGSGNIYTSGYTNLSLINTLSSGGHQNLFGGTGTNALLIKFDAAGSRLWATYYGGDNFTYGQKVAVDPVGEVYLVGSTNSTTAIASSFGFQLSLDGTNDGFIVKFDNTGGRLWGSYYGGSASDEITSIAIDVNSNVYLAGTTLSDTILANHISSPGAHQGDFGGGFGDAFLAKFNSAGGRIWGTYYGDIEQDEAKDCIVDREDNVYLVGYTKSSLSIASGGYRNAISDPFEFDGFIVKFKNDGTRLWGTYYGGFSEDKILGCSSDASNNLYITGSTKSDTGISKSGHQMNQAGSLQNDAFLAKFNKAGSFLWGTYYGGAEEDAGVSCSADNKGNIFLLGNTFSADSIARDGIQSSLGSVGKSDLLLAKFNTNGIRRWGTYFGGNDNDYGFGLTTDNFYNIILCGNTTSANWPTQFAFLASYGGMTDGVITSLSDSTPPAITIDASMANPICQSAKITFTRIVTKGGSAPQYEWYKNGILVGIDSIYIDSTLADLDSIQCRVKSNDSSLTIDTAWSNVLYLNVLATQFVTVNNSICAGDSLFFKGAFRYPPGIFKDTLKDLVNGCDSIVTLNLTIRPKDTVQYAGTQVICKYSSYFFIDTVVSDSGRHFRRYTNVAGCDSAVYVDVVVRPQLTLPAVFDTVCSNVLPKIYNGNSYSMSGSYLDSIPDVATGCYDLFTYNLFVKTAPANTNLSVSVCSNKTYFFNGSFLNTAGTYRDTFVSSNGCDSFVILNLSVKPYDSSLINRTICNGASYFFAGKYRTTTGLFYDTLVGSNGCDSFAVLNLFVLNKITKSLTPVICSNDKPYYFKGKNRDTTGIFYDTLKSVLTGCDSFVTLTLLVIPISYGTYRDSICESTDTMFFFNGDTFRKPGIYYDTLINAKLCDSIVTIIFKVMPKTRDTIRKYFCTGTTYLFGKNKSKLTKTGIYYDTLVVKNKNGCDSITVLDLRIGLNKKVTLDDGINYKAWQDSVSYQWYYCYPWRLIKDATKPTFSTTTKGSYAVVISDGRCTDTTDCIKLFTYGNTTGLAAIDKGGIQIYPNPTNDRLMIESSKSESKVKIDLYDLVGKKVMEKQIKNFSKMELELRNLANGVYMLHYESESRNEVFKIEKE